MLERANPEWGEPTLGTLRHGEFLYVADAQWERFGAAGAEQGDPRACPFRLKERRNGVAVITALA